MPYVDGFVVAVPKRCASSGRLLFMRPLEVNDDTLAVDAIKAVGPGGHFFGSPHTMERYETAFYAPMVSDWRNFENWTLAGSVQAAQHANVIWKQLLEEYTPPPLDPAIDEALKEYVAKRKAEGGVPGY